MTRVITALGICAALVLSARPADASTISIQFTGLDAIYDGFDLYDAGSQFGGNQNPVESDPLVSMDFFEDGVLVGSLTSSIYADFAVVDLGPIPVGGGAVSSPFGGFFDLLTSDLGWGLGLDFTSFHAFFDADALTLLVQGISSEVLGQALPFGLTIKDPVHVSFLLNLGQIGSEGGRLTRFTGTGDGVAVPEPAALLLVGVGLAVVVLRRRASRHTVRS